MKSCLNERRPLRKAKYSSVTDSEPVPWGKGEKNPGRGVKRIWNCMPTRSQRALKPDDVPIEEWAGELRSHAWLSRRGGAAGKPSLKGAICVRAQTRSPTIYPWPGWNRSKIRRRSEPTFVAMPADELWIVEKFQSSRGIAGSPRNSFRASVWYPSRG